MKLNLLPTYVSKGKQTAAAWIVFALIVVGCVLVTVGMIQVSSANLKAAKDHADSLQAPADNAVKVAGEYSDAVLTNARGVILNSMLAQEMIKHNSAYPDFYDGVRPHIPSFFRVTSMSATPDATDPGLATLTLTGVIQTQQQYRDLMLALNQIPGARSVSRTGFESDDRYVPGLVAIDQAGRPILRSDTHVPDDALDRMNYYLQKGMANGGMTGFVGAGRFGTGEAGVKGAMPKWSLITVTVVMTGKLQTPNPRATLVGGGAGGGAAASGAGGGTGAPAGMPGPGGPPAGGAGGAPGAAPGMAGGTGKAGAPPTASGAAPGN